MREQTAAPKYLRVSIARWTLDLRSAEAQRIFRQIETEGVAVFRKQPGFISYRLMRSDGATTIAVAEWQSEELGRVGAERYREWMRAAGIMDRLTLDTHAGEIVARS
jgi:heme-degrading monooxygenase HmoA